MRQFAWRGFANIFFPQAGRSLVVNRRHRIASFKHSPRANQANCTSTAKSRTVSFFVVNEVSALFFWQCGPGAAFSQKQFPLALFLVLHLVLEEVRRRMGVTPLSRSAFL
jgi:hypothetical protein